MNDKIQKTKLVLFIFFAVITTGLISNSIFNYIDEINYFGINKIVVSGNNFLKEKAINNIVYEKIKSQTTFSVNLEKVQESINDHSFIYSSNIYLMLPNSIFINVKEINPIALYEKNNEIFFIDYYYQLIKADTESINFFNVPIINQNQITNYKYTETGKLIKRIIHNSDYLFKDINEIEYIHDDVYINMNGETKIILSRKDQMNELDVLFEFMSKINNNIYTYKYIDLRTRNQIIVKEKHKTI